MDARKGHEGVFRFPRSQRASADRVQSTVPVVLSSPMRRMGSLSDSLMLSSQSSDTAAGEERKREAIGKLSSDCTVVSTCDMSSTIALSTTKN